MLSYVCPVCRSQASLELVICQAVDDAQARQMIEYLIKTYQPSLGAAIRQPSRAIASLMLQYRLHPQAMLSLHVNNLFNQRYYTSYGAFTQYQWGAPRNVQLGFNYSF